MTGRLRIDALTRQQVDRLRTTERLQSGALAGMSEEEEDNG